METCVAGGGLSGGDVYLCVCVCVCVSLSLSVCVNEYVFCVCVCPVLFCVFWEQTCLCVCESELNIAANTEDE